MMMMMITGSFFPLTDHHRSVDDSPFLMHFLSDFTIIFFTATSNLMVQICSF